MLLVVRAPEKFGNHCIRRLKPQVFNRICLTKLYAWNQIKK